MENTNISSLLERRGAWLKGEPVDYTEVLARADLTRAIGEHYPEFELLRDHVLRMTEAIERRLEVTSITLTDNMKYIASMLRKHGLTELRSNDIDISTAAGRRYLSGLWLEEYAWLAAIESGAEEAVVGQVLGWNVKGFQGENEIDLIALKNGQLSFVSCKALRSHLDIQDRKHRNRLMDAVHEADNLADHFGRPGDQVAVLVTTDLFDELRGVVRYNALMGKAAVLDVRIIPLEDMSWPKLVKDFTDLWVKKDAIENDKV